MKDTSSPKPGSSEIETYGHRLRKYERREKIIGWIGAGFLGLVALVSMGDVLEGTSLALCMKRVVVTSIIIGAAASAMARIKFEWEATQIARDIEDEKISPTTQLPISRKEWLNAAEYYYYVALGCIILGGVLILIGIWLPHPFDVK